MVLTKVGKKRVYPYAEFYEQIEKNKVIANPPEAAPMYGGLYGQTVQRAVYPYEKQTQPQQTSGYAALAEVPVAEVPAPTAKKPLSYAYTTPQTEDQYAEWYKKNGTQKMSQSEYDTMQGVTRNYAEYARRMGVPEVQAQAESDYSRALSGYGVKAEKMAQAGIHGGYSDYLGSAAYAEMQRAKENAEQTARKGYADQIAGADAGYAQYAYGVGQQNKENYRAYKAGEEAKTVSEDQYRQYLIASGMTEDEANAAVERARSVAGNLDAEGYASYLDTSASIERSKIETEKAEKASEEQQKANVDTAAAKIYASLEEDGTVFAMSDEDYKNSKDSLIAQLKGNGASDEVIGKVIGRVEDTRRANYEKNKVAAASYMTKFMGGEVDDKEFLGAFGYTSDVIDEAVQSYMEANDADEDDARSIVVWDYIIKSVDNARKDGLIDKDQESAFIKDRLPMYSAGTTPTEEEGWQKMGEIISDSVEFAVTYYNDGMLTEADKNKIIADALDMIFGGNPKTITYDRSFNGLRITLANGVTLKADITTGKPSTSAKASLNKNFADCPIGLYDGKLYFKDKDGDWKALKTKKGSEGTPGEGDNYFKVIARAMQGKKYDQNNGKTKTYLLASLPEQVFTSPIWTQNSEKQLPQMSHYHN